MLVNLQMILGQRSLGVENLPEMQFNLKMQLSSQILEYEEQGNI